MIRMNLIQAREDVCLTGQKRQLVDQGIPMAQIEVTQSAHWGPNATPVLPSTLLLP